NHYQRRTSRKGAKSAKERQLVFIFSRSVLGVPGVLVVYLVRLCALCAFARDSSLVVPLIALPWPRPGADAGGTCTRSENPSTPSRPLRDCHRGRGRVCRPSVWPAAGPSRRRSVRRTSGGKRRVTLSRPAVFGTAHRAAGRPVARHGNCGTPHTYW